MSEKLVHNLKEENANLTHSLARALDEKTRLEDELRDLLIRYNRVKKNLEEIEIYASKIIINVKAGD